MKSEIGNKYGHLLVIEDAGTDSTKHKQWKCRCDCGNEVIVRGSRLRNGEKTDCGCIKKHGFIDETGKRYGRLTVLDMAPNTNKDRGIKWRCLCDCGNETIVSGRDLRQGKTKSCGCYMKEVRGQSVVKDEIGNRYGKLVVLKRANSINGKAAWLCKCDCGNETIVSGSDLRSGKVKSCGCLQSWGEQTILSFLQENNIVYEKEKCFTDLITSNNGHPRFDFAIFNDKELYCLIEYQGEQHIINKGDFGKQQREVTDQLKKQYCKEHNIVLYEIFYYDNIEESLQQILQPLCEYK